MPVEALGLEHIVRAREKLDVPNGGLAADSIRLVMMELDEGPLIAPPPALADERSLDDRRRITAGKRVSDQVPGLAEILPRLSAHRDPDFVALGSQGRNNRAPRRRWRSRRQRQIRTPGTSGGPERSGNGVAAGSFLTEEGTSGLGKSRASISSTARLLIPDAAANNCCWLSAVK